MDTRDMSHICAAGGPPSDAPQAIALHLPLRIFHMSEKQVFQGHWNLQPGSWLIPKGDELGFVQSTDGEVTLVSCGAQLEFRICPDQTSHFLPEGIGLNINPTNFPNGIRFTLPSHGAFITIIAANEQSVSVVVEAQGTDATYEVCTSEGEKQCWSSADAEDPNIECGIFRCP